MENKLQDAAKSGNINVARMCLEQGVDVNFCKGGDWPPLVWAASENNMAIVKLFLDKGANINAITDRGNTALMVAACNGHTAVASVLLDRGANINAANLENKTALGWATQYNQIALVTLLHQRGALLETIIPTKSLEDAAQTDPPAVVIAVAPTPETVNHPQVNQYSAPVPAVAAPSAPINTPGADTPISTSAPANTPGADTPISTSAPANTPGADTPISTSAPAYPTQEGAHAPASTSTSASGGISSYIPKHVPTPTRAQVAMAAGALGAISKVSVMAGGAIKSQGGTEAASALNGFGNASAYAARATSGMNGIGMNANTAAKATATAAKLLQMSGLSSMF